MIDAAARFAVQLPPDHWHDDFPGLAGVEPPVIFGNGMPYVCTDGTPVVPHRTWLGLVHHITSHANQAAAIPRNIEFSWTRFGQPPPGTPVSECVTQLHAASAAVHVWWAGASPDELDRVIPTGLGPKTIQQRMQHNTYSLVQHTRQLMIALVTLGIEPDGPIGDAEYEGLRMPDDVWERD